MSFKRIDPPTVHRSAATYSHVQATSISSTCTLITIAGQVGVNSKTGDIPSNHREQIQLALENLRACLESAGATSANIISLTHYVVNLDPNDRFRSELLVDFLGGHRPPGALVGVTALAHPGLSYEVQAMAIVEKK